MLLKVFWFHTRLEDAHKQNFYIVGHSIVFVVYDV